MNRKSSLVVLIVAGFAAIAFSVAPSGCGGDDNCAVDGENCSSSYLQSKGLSGCCDGLTCKSSTVTNALVCKY